MIQDEQCTSTLVAAGVKEASTHILAYIREVGLDPISVMASAAPINPDHRHHYPPDWRELAA